MGLFSSPFTRNIHLASEQHQSHWLWLSQRPSFTDWIRVNIFPWLSLGELCKPTTSSWHLPTRWCRHAASHSEYGRCDIIPASLRPSSPCSNIGWVDAADMSSVFNLVIDAYRRDSAYPQSSCSSNCHQATLRVVQSLIWMCWQH